MGNRKSREFFGVTYVAKSVGTLKRKHPKVGRNNPCPCGSGKKFKKCCMGGKRND
ncbi:MAG: SEC-C domain-containing protein [Desulfobacterales bacterium]|nr:SEC-C domain-containing protein [Desulfobacterales bacterium]